MLYVALQRTEKYNEYCRIASCTIFLTPTVRAAVPRALQLQGRWPKPKSQSERKTLFSLQSQIQVKLVLSRPALSFLWHNSSLLTFHMVIRHAKLSQKATKSADSAHPQKDMTKQNANDECKASACVQSSTWLSRSVVFWKLVVVILSFPLLWGQCAAMMQKLLLGAWLQWCNDTACYPLWHIMPWQSLSSRPMPGNTLKIILQVRVHMWLKILELQICS